MSAPDKDRLERLFDRLIGQPPELRDAILDVECAAEPELRRAVEDRLRLGASTLQLQDANAEPAFVGASIPMVGQTIGRYRILSVLGEGGFGIVYEAEQVEPVRRRVAIKVVKPGMDSRAVLARFDAERQALAVMDHACIARIYDGGETELGRPYFVMELVKGESLTDFCDMHKLSIQTRVELFIDVCEAVQHAHMKGVIHRDLKPSNILVAYGADGRAQPKVIDFGVAKALNQRLSSQAIFTEQGQLIGTPKYMSPEQLDVSGLDIDTRSDVYSLGVVLYQLLTGMMPFETDGVYELGVTEIQRRIRDLEPPRPSTRLSSTRSDAATRMRIISARDTDLRDLTTTLKRDLDWVVMRCLEKDRGRRYSSASDIADELRRFLRDEPVVAGPPSTVYRLKKFTKRHRVGVVAGVAIAAALVLAVIGTTWGMLWAFAERDRAEQAELETSQRAAELEQVAGFQSEQLGMLDAYAMGQDIQQSIQVASSKDEQRAVEQSALEGINFTNIALATLERSIFKGTINAIDRRFEDQPLVRAQLLHSTGVTMRELGLYDAAGDPQERALGIRRLELGDEDMRTLESIDAMGSLLRSRREYEEAGVYTREALETSRSVLSADDPFMATAVYHMGIQHMHESFESPDSWDFALAEARFREAVVISSRALGPEDPQTLKLIGSLNHSISGQGKYAKAEVLHRELLARCRRTLGDDHPLITSLLLQLGGYLQCQGKLAEAEGFIRTALEIRQRVDGDRHPATRYSVVSLIDILAEQGKAGEAMALNQSILMGSDPSVLGRMTGYAIAHGRAGRHDLAEAIWRAIVGSRRRSQGDNHPETLRSMRSHAEVLEVMGRPVDALVVWQEILSLAGADTGEAAPVALKATERVDKLARAQRERANALAAEPNASATALNDASRGLLTLDDQRDAEAEMALTLAQRARTIAEEVGGVQLAMILETLALAQRQTGDLAGAVESQRRALDLAQPDSKKRADMVRRLDEFISALKAQSIPR